MNTAQTIEAAETEWLTAREQRDAYTTRLRSLIARNADAELVANSRELRDTQTALISELADAYELVSDEEFHGCEHCGELFPESAGEIVKTCCVSWDCPGEFEFNCSDCGYSH